MTCLPEGVGCCSKMLVAVLRHDSSIEGVTWTGNLGGGGGGTIVLTPRTTETPVKRKKHIKITFKILINIKSFLSNIFHYYQLRKANYIKVINSKTRLSANVCAKV